MKSTPTTPFGALLLDFLTGAYIASCIVFVILPELFAFEARWGLTTIAILVAASVITTALSITGMASLGRFFLTGSLPESALGKKLTQNIGWLTLSCSIVAGWIITDVQPLEFFSGQGLAGAGRIFGALLTPNFDIIVEALSAMVVTIYTAFLATIVAVPISFVIAFPAARNVMNNSPLERVIYSILRAFLNITRSMEPIIWAIIFSVWVGIGPFAGMLALVVHTIASLAKLYSEQIEGVADGPIEAIEATGATRLQVLWFAVVPQCVLPFLSFTIYRWDINVRMATIIGFVGGGGIGTLLTQYQGLARYQEVGTLVIIITAVVWLLDVISARIRAVLK